MQPLLCVFGLELTNCISKSINVYVTLCCRSPCFLNSHTHSRKFMPPLLPFFAPLAPPSLSYVTRVPGAEFSSGSARPTQPALPTTTTAQLSIPLPPPSYYIHVENYPFKWTYLQPPSGHRTSYWTLIRRYPYYFSYFKIVFTLFEVGLTRSTIFDDENTAFATRWGTKRNPALLTVNNCLFCYYYFF